MIGSFAVILVVATMAPPFLSSVVAFLISWVRLPTMNSGLVGVDDLALAWPFGLSPTFRSSSQPAERTRSGEDRQDGQMSKVTAREGTL